MGNYCPRLARKAGEAEDWFRVREKRSFRQSYWLDIKALADAWLTTFEWNQIFFLDSDEWERLTTSDNVLSAVGEGHHVDGFSSPLNKCVYINLNGSEEKIRFTVAHELGHVLLHHRSKAYPDTEGLPYDAEVEANEFARMLLVPPRLAQQWRLENENLMLENKNLISAKNIAQALARDFGVSTKVAAKALKTVGYLPDDMELVLTARDYQFPEKKF